MPWLIKLFVPGERLLSGDSFIGTCRSTWERVRLKLPEPQTVHSGCYVPDSDPAAELLPIRAKNMRGFASRRDEEVVRIDTPRTVAAPIELAPARVIAQRATEAAALFGLATGRGWQTEDIAGTGPDDGRSRRTGLTLPEMALTRPPVDWTALAGKGRPPWESGDWTPPVPGWRQPSWPEPIPPAALPSGEPGKPIDGDGSLSVSQTDGDGAPLNDGAGDTKPPGGTADENGHGTDEALPWEPAVLEAIAAVILDIKTKKNGAIPAPNAVNFLLKRGKLPTVTKAQIAQICAA